MGHIILLICCHAQALNKIIIKVIYFYSNLRHPYDALCEEQIQIQTIHQRYVLYSVANYHETNKLPQLQKQTQNKPNIIYYQVFITNKWACNILNWNRSFIWKAKTFYNLKRNQHTATKVGTKLISNHLWAE